MTFYGQAMAGIDCIGVGRNLPPPPPPATDQRCIALWNLEPGALTADFIGGNTLSNTGVTADTSDCQQGSGSGVFDGNSYLTIADADLNAGFPLKSGDTRKRFTISGIIKFAADNDYQHIISKWDWFYGDHNSFGFRVRYFPDLQIIWGNTWLTTNNQPIVLNSWFRFVIIADGNAGWCMLRLKNLDNNNYYSYCWNDLGLLPLFDVPLTIGSLSNAGGVPWAFHGKSDQLAVFNDCLSIKESDQLLNASFPGDGTLPEPVTPCNEFSGDGRVVSVYRFEGNPGLLRDATGANHLFNNMVSEDAITPLEGQQSGRFINANSSNAAIPDAFLSANFPLRSADTIKRGAWLIRFKVTSNAPLLRYILIEKGLRICFNWSVHQIAIEWNNQLFPLFAPITDDVYHVAVQFDGENKQLYVKAYDITTDEEVYKQTLEPADILPANAAPFSIGVSYDDGLENVTGFDGWIDEVVVAADWFTEEEIDEIRACAYARLLINESVGLAAGASLMAQGMKILLSLKRILRVRRRDRIY